MGSRGARSPILHAHKIYSGSCRVLTYPVSPSAPASDAGPLFYLIIFFFIKLICWLRDTHKKGGNSAPFVRQWDCHGMSPQLERRDLHQNRVPIFPRRDHRSQQVDEKEGKWRRREGISAEACSSCLLGLHHRQRRCTSGFTCHLHTRRHSFIFFVFFFPSGPHPCSSRSPVSTALGYADKSSTQISVSRRWAKSDSVTTARVSTLRLCPLCHLFSHFLW